MHAKIALGLTLLVTAACGQEWPREIRVDQRFTAQEMTEIRAAVSEVNKLGGLIDQDQLVKIAGRFTDEDGNFSQGNVDDGEDQLYRIGSAEQCWEFVKRYQSRFGVIDNLYGFFTGTDIGILVFNTYRDNRSLRCVVMHELGHMAGMDHVTNNRHAVMDAHSCGVLSFTAADREQFCLQHGCDPD